MATTWKEIQEYVKCGILRLGGADSVGRWVSQYASQLPSLSEMFIKAPAISQGHWCL